MPIKPVDQWSVDDVCTWLTAVGLGKQAQPFQDNGVDGGLLVSMSVDDLTKDLGLDSFQAKKVLHELDFAKSLSSASSSSSSSSGGAPTPPDDSDEVKQLEGEVSQLQVTGANLQDEVQDKDQKIQQLEQEVATLKHEVNVLRGGQPHYQHQSAPPMHHAGGGHPILQGATGGTARGAVQGAVVGAIRGDAAQGAAAGAAMGATGGAMGGLGHRLHER